MPVSQAMNREHLQKYLRVVWECSVHIYATHVTQIPDISIARKHYNIVGRGEYENDGFNCIGSNSAWVIIWWTSAIFLGNYIGRIADAPPNIINV